MTLRLSNIDLSSWDGILAFLRAELDGASSEQRRALLLESMAFVESDGLGDKDAAVSSLSQALGIDAGRSQSLWELWRNFDRLGNGDQEQVLSLLANLPEPSGDVEQRLLRLARFQRDTLGKDELAASLVEQARRQWPEGFHGLLAEVETRLLAGHPSEAATSLERLSRMVDDACVRAALLVEAAWLRKDSSSDDDITRLLEEALSEPVADWALIRETMDLAAEIGDWVLYESSLRKVAGAALENPDSEGGQWPMGHSFDGFERGPAVSAAYWWQVAMVRERRLGRPQAAAEALERALQICPGHPLLGYEHSRLMEALGHFDDALTSLPDSASKTRRAELLLLAGRSKEAAALFGEPAGDTVVEWALRDLLGVPALPSAQDLDAVMVFLHAHPEHAQARTAAQMLLEHRDDEVAKLVISETAPKSTLWPPASTFSVHPTWQVASQAACALTSEDGTEAKRAILDWAEASSDATLRAVLTSVAARMTEESGELEQAFELYEYAQSLSPQTPAARLATLRLLLRLERYPDLVTHLLDHAATSSSPFHARAMLHQAGHIFRCKLCDGPSAARVVDELCSGDSSDVPALWSAFELAIEAQDYSRAVDFLGRIGQQCPGDADWLCLLAAEIELFLTGDYDNSLSFLDRAAESTDEAVGRTARLYRMLVFYFRGDVTSLDEALQEEVLSSQDETGRMWIPELLEAGRGARGPEAMAELLEADDNSGPVKLLWLLLVGAMSGETSKLVTGLRALGSGAPPGEIAAACRAAAMVLDLSIDLTRAADLAHSDLEFTEVLYHASERLTRAVPPERRAEIALGRAELCRDYDLADWADWRLEAAEAFVDMGDRSRGLSILQESLAVALEHPGLLEAYAGLADALHDHTASLDAHCRLAAIYDDPSEKAHQLSLAASRAALELGLKEEGLRLARQAVEADPGSDVAHSSLTAVQRIAGDAAGVQVAIVGHLAATADPAKRVLLLRELADHQLKLGDAEGCLTTLDQLLELDSTQTDALLRKIEILAGAGLVVEQLEVMDIYIRQEVDLAKASKMAWRASDLAEQTMSDRQGAIERLRFVEARGDGHPETQQRLAILFEQGQNWEQAAEALHRLASLEPDQEKRTAALYQEACIRLERLFDDEGASLILKEILQKSPSHLPALELTHNFCLQGDDQMNLDRALHHCFSSLAENPADLSRIGELKQIALLAGQRDIGTVCDEAVAFFSMVAPVSVVEAILEPTMGKADELRACLRSSQALHPAGLVAQIAAEAAAEAFDHIGRALQLGRGTRLGRRDVSPLRDWLEKWGGALGFEELEMHAAGAAPEGSLCLPGAIPTIAICGDVGREPSDVDRFFAVFNLIRSAQGLGAFIPSDHSGPQRWVLAVASSLLGESTALPIPTDLELVHRARKKLSRKARAKLEEPSSRLVQQTAASLREWSAGCIAEADRAGLLSAGHLFNAMQALIEQEAGDAGAQLLRSDPLRQLSRLPRGQDLLGFALSGQFHGARRIAISGDRGNGGSR